MTSAASGIVQGGRREQLQRPALPVRICREGGGLLGICHLQIHWIPEQFLVTDPDGNAAEQDRFGERPGKSKVRFGGRPSLAGPQPFSW